MIKFDGSFPWAPRILCLTLCFCLVVRVHGKQNLNELKKKDARYDSKIQSTKAPDGQYRLKVNPEMVLLTGLQQNNLNLIPIKVDAPKEIYMSKPGEKPIVISVSNDKQVLSEENRMLPTPILFNANLTDAEFFRNLWLRLNSTAAAQKAATVSASTMKVTSKNKSMTEGKSADLGQLRRNEMKPTLAAIHKDFEIANEASADLTDNFNQTLSSDQLLCVIYKLLTLYKPNFATGNCPASAARRRIPKYPYTSDKPTTLKPIDNILYNLALSKTSSPIRYKSPWSYHTSPPNDFGCDAATCAAYRKDYGLSDGPISVQNAASILNTLPLVKTFNKYSSLPDLSIDGDLSEPFSAPMNKPNEESLSSFEVKNQKHKSETNGENLNHIDRNTSQIPRLKDGEKIDSRNIQNHDNALRDRIHTISNVTAKRLQQPASWSDLSEDTYNLYTKLFQQLQNNRHNHLNALQPSGMDFLHSLTHMQQAQSIGKNHTLPTSLSDFSLNDNKVHLGNTHQSYTHLLKNRNSPPNKSLDGNAFGQPVSAYYSPEKDGANRLKFSDQKRSNRIADHEKDSKENFSSNSRLSHLKQLKKAHKTGKKTAEKRKKKFQLQIKKKSKMEGKKKTLDFDFLDLLSKSMIRESKNFEGRI